jgi:predicted xylose isomerase-like sugar epimerase
LATTAALAASTFHHGLQGRGEFFFRDFTISIGINGIKAFCQSFRDFISG